MTCQYQLTAGPCGAPIEQSAESYTGWKHCREKDENGQRIDWLHWATAKPHKGDERPEFLSCAICGKLPDDNDEHFKVGGHSYRADLSLISCNSNVRISDARIFRQSFNGGLPARLEPHRPTRYGSRPERNCDAVQFANG